jgi:RHS repeat-associated protein
MIRFRFVLVALVLGIPRLTLAQSGDVILYYHTDAIGSVRMITDATAQVLARYDYLPFGEESSPPAFRDPRLFAGKERDAETVFDYVGARYYASQTGRFTSVDPGHVGGDIFNPQSWNAYAYALNNPLRFVDPLGTCSQDTQGNYVDGDDAGTLVAPGPCPRGKDGGLAIGITETVSVKSKPAIVALAEGISVGAGPVADPLFIAGFYGTSALGGLAVAGATAGVGAEAITLGVARLAPLAPLAGQLNFTDTVLKHMSNPGRMVPIQTLAEAIRSGTRMPDPQGAAGAVKIVQQVFVNGTPRTLEIIYREADKTILHFLYK